MFVEAKYLPQDVKIRQPCNLTKAVIEEIFEYIAQRQDIDGPQAAFRFKRVKIGKNLVTARYPGAPHPLANADADAGVRTTPPKDSREGAAIRKNNQNKNHDIAIPWDLERGRGDTRIVATPHARPQEDNPW
jgi:hypothetical protein